MTFRERLVRAQATSGSLLCVGLDPVVERFPDQFGASSSAIRRFNQLIIEATADLACCYKPNLGFYLPYGHHGIDALAHLREDIPAEIPVLLDAKIGDIGTTTAAYARAYFDAWNFDAVTAHAYMGHDSLQPLLDYEDRAVFVLAKTSNPGSGLLQDRVLADADGAGETVALAVTREAVTWETSGNVGLVVGATYPSELATIRAAAPDLPILVPGVGAQRGDTVAAVRAGLDKHRAGLLVNATRAINYASSGADFQDAARKAALAILDQIEEAQATAGAVS